MEQTFPLQRAVAIIGRCATELVARPDPNDIATLILRGEADDSALGWGSAAWAMVDEEDRRVLFMVHAALSDAEVRARVGKLPGAFASIVAAVVTRVGPTMRTPETFSDKLRHEALARLVASALELPIEGEREGTSRYMLSTLDNVTIDLEKEKTEFARALTNAKSAIDAKHAPARPYGE